MLLPLWCKNPPRRKSPSPFFFPELMKTEFSHHAAALIHVIRQPYFRAGFFFTLLLLLKFSHSQISVRSLRSGLHSNSLKVNYF